MILVFQFACMAVTLYVIQKYLTMGTYSRTHRLLPLVLGLIGVYNFYEIVASITGAAAVVALLEDLLLLQVLYLIIFYCMDFLERRIPGWLTNFMFVMIVVLNIIVISRYGQPEKYARDFLRAVLGSIGAMIAFGTYAYIHSYSSKRKHHVANMLYLALLLPTAAIILKKLGVVEENILLSLALIGTCGIIYYLIVTGQLMDSMFVLQEMHYERSDIPIILFDADYYYLGANRAAKRIFPRELSVSAKRARPELYLEDIRTMARRSDKCREIELEGRNYKCQLNAVYYDDRLKGYSLSIIDITDQKKETRLMASLKDAAETQTAQKSRFLATMSHDLRSPLHGIIGVCDLLAERCDISARNRSLIYHIRDAGNTLLTQVDAILEFSKLESGKLELSRNKYNLNRIIEELAHTSVINLQSKSVDFSVCIRDEYPQVFIGDEMRVREMIQNLLSNAVKFTKEGKICCEITCDRLEKEHKAYISCRVTDSGIGMSREQINQIFEEYVSFSEKSSQEGAGLGLCIVRQLAELMGGTVSASSDGKTGSVFTVSFYQEYEGEETYKAHVISGDSMLAEKAELDNAVRPKYLYPGARVLLADDMRINQEIFKELTAPWKFQLDFAENGKDAVDAVKRQQYQLILLDQVMPEMTGDEAAAVIRDYCDTPIILLTSNQVADRWEVYQSYGFTDFLAKPIELGALQAILEKYLPAAYRSVTAYEENTGLLNHMSENWDAQANRRTLEAFVGEMSPLIHALMEYAENDLNMFRIKVHGIKGVSRQIGRISLSESAEILEMAAKTENVSFIQRHILPFMQEFKMTIQEIQEELLHMPVQTEPPVPQQETDILFAELKMGFAAYRIEEIEKSLAALAQAELTEQETRLFQQAKEAYDELDYEAGSALFAE